VARLGAVRKKKLRGKGGVAVSARWSAVDFRSSVGFACRLVGRQGRFSHLNTRHSPDRPNPPPNPPAHPPKKTRASGRGEQDAAADVHAAAGTGGRNHHRTDPKGASYRRQPFRAPGYWWGSVWGVVGGPFPVKDWTPLLALIRWGYIWIE
jgi:hypothetical protein